MVLRCMDVNLFRRLLPAVITLTLVVVSHAADFYLEAANSRGHPHVVKRTGARSGLAVQLAAGESIQLTFCLRQKTVMQILGVLHSNDGKNKTAAVVVDDIFVGTFTTRGESDWGRLWNVFVSSPALPRTLAMTPGWHTLRLGLLLPSAGLELDSVHVWFNDEGLTRAIVDCELFCRMTLPSVPPSAVQLWQKAEVTQASYPTKCAEEDNVKVPLYLGGVSEYRVTATMPTYVSFSNRREPNTTGCAFLDPILWSFSSLPQTTSQPFSRSAPGASLIAYRYTNTTKQVFRIEFLLQGRSRGHVDAEMGSGLTIHFQKLSAQILIRSAYMGRTGSLGPMENSVVHKGQRQHKLEFPDHTWRENVSNLLLLELQSGDPVHVTEIVLERRPMTGETVRTVFRSDELVVEAIEVDFWWRRPETMTLRNGETGQSWSLVDFFRISLHVPWNGGFAQVLVMYQDGNVRLVPLPPPGIDWIPFGSSLIVGFSDPADLRPCAPVTSVTFYPSTLRLRVHYYDGGSAKLQLESTRSTTEIVVSDIHSKSSDQWRLPFATLRSMYIEDGNSDCDSLLVDGKSYRPIMNQWGSLKGQSFFFFRRCESQHLTLSPDIRIDVTKTSYVGVGGGGGGLTSNNWWWHLFSQDSQKTNN